jgi:hypothetical protein
VPDDETIVRVIAANPSGYAETTLSQLKDNGSIRLAPWSRLEGDWRSAGIRSPMPGDLAGNGRVFIAELDGSGGASLERLITIVITLVSA